MESQTPPVAAACVAVQAPSPRLSAGSLVADRIEILALTATFGAYNLYEGVDADGPVCLLERAAEGAVAVAPCEEVAYRLCALPEVVTTGARTYAIFPGGIGRAWRDVYTACREEEVVGFLEALLEGVMVLHAAGVDLAGLGPESVVLLSGRPHFLPVVFAAATETDPAAVVAALVDHLLFRCLLPRVTRNLQHPLRRLGLSLDAETALTRFLDDRDVAALQSWLRARTAAPAPRWDVWGDTHTGKVRDHNEDAFGWTSTHVVSHEGRHQTTFVAVSDGMGGHARGEEAARLALATFLGECTDPALAPGADNPEQRDRVARAFASASQTVHEAFSDVQRSEQPGATLVAATLVGRTLFLGNCGDSRAYLWHDGGFRRLTRDHSLIQLYIDRGLLTEEEGEHSDNHVITSFVGIEARAFKCDVAVHHLPPGSRVLFCSDGLTDMVKADAMAAILGAATDSHAATDALIAAALEAGGHDNITVLVLCDHPSGGTCARPEQGE